jgi:hypothetical protein
LKRQQITTSVLAEVVLNLRQRWGLIEKNLPIFVLFAALKRVSQVDIKFIYKRNIRYQFNKTKLKESGAAMNKYRWVVGLSFVLIVFSFIWLFRAEIVCSLLFYRSYSNVTNNAINNLDFTSKIDSALTMFVETNSEAFNPVLLKYLGSKDEEKAQFAAGLLNMNNTISSSDFIKAYNQTQFLSVKGNIINLLPDDQKGLDFLKQLFINRNTNPEIRVYCGFKLCNENDPDVVKAGMELLDHPDPHIRTGAICCFEYSRNGLYFEKIRKMILDKDCDVRRMAIGMSYFKSKTLYPEYLRTLQDNDQSVVNASLRAIESCGDKKAIPHLENLIKTTKDKDVKQKAIDVLRKLKQ